MRCGRCRKNFDEEMYSGICPKCGHFNNRQTEYDVNKYFSATFEDGGKTSTSSQAAKQHEQLHRAYDSTNMHKPGPGQHENLHRMYDRHPMHQKTVTSSAGIPLGKPNPYQTMMSGSVKQTGQSGANGQKGTYPAGNTITYGGNSYGKTNTYGEEKKKNLVTPVCIVIAVLVIVGTGVACQLKKQSLEEIYQTVEFAQETVQAGETFELNERLLVAKKARVVDTSAVEGIPAGEKLVAVTMEILPAKAWDGGDISGDVYVWDGSSYKIALDSYVVLDLLYDGDYSMDDGILSKYLFYGYIREDGEEGEVFFLVDEDAGELVISFEEGSEEDGLYVLHRRVSIPLQLEEDRDHE